MIRTVLGSLDPSAAGIVDSHDHLFLSTPLLPGDELDDAAAATDDLRGFAQQGGGTLIQWTPRGLKRGLDALRRISESTGVHIVAATGRHRRALYPRHAPGADLDPNQLADAFIRDLVNNDCGLIKVGVSYEEITPDEVDALYAAAVAHHATSAPIAVHLEQGSAADLVLDRLFAENVPARSIILGHVAKNPDPDGIANTAQAGTWLCLDAPSPRNRITTDQLARIAGRLVDQGHSSQLLLGADTTTAGSRTAPRQYGPSGLLTDVMPQLTEALGTDKMTEIMVTNPALAWSVPL
ncbi:hypothetical protein ACFVWR_13300 [Leifsonia sp. NPDC058292]|uniref:phosphotriesterase family protein n=1 Tax=Leifsonia sp. NPDC058292 TaxID=3346428 RepID=UPI0036DA9929